MSPNEIFEAWKQFNPVVGKELTIAKYAADWLLFSDHRSLLLEGEAGQGKSVFAQSLYLDLAKIYEDVSSLRQPIYMNFELVYADAFNMQNPVCLNTTPLTYFQMAVTEMIRTTHRIKPDFLALPTFNELLESTTRGASVVILDNFERMFENLDWPDSRRKMFFYQAVECLMNLDKKGTSKFVFMSRPESYPVSNRAIDKLNPLWMRMHNLPTKSA